MIGWFTLRPSLDDAEAAARLPWTCLYPCGDYGLRDAVLNVALFVPLGLALALMGHPVRALLLVLLSTVSVEFAQYHWLIGRDASLRDILTNSLGGGIGVLLAGAWRSLLLPPVRRSAWFAAVAAVLWVGGVALTAYLVRPSLPRSVYWGQWAPELGQFAPWGGTLLSASVDDQPLPVGRLRNSEDLRARLLQDSVLVEASIVTGPPTTGLASIVSVFDSEQREIFVLGQSGSGFAFRIRTGLSALELGELTAYLPDPPETRPGDTLTVRGGVVHGAWYVAVASATARVERWIPFEAGLLWGSLIPYHPVLGPLAALWSGLWLGALLFPAGYWAGRGRIPGLLVAGLAVGMLWLAGHFAGLAPPPAAEWVGTAVGGLAGTGVGRWSRGDARRVAPATLH